MVMALHNTVYAAGNGVPVVLVHGFPVDHRMWDECAARLRRFGQEAGVEFPLWAPDMPGAGLSPVPSPGDGGVVEPDGAYAQGLDAVADAYVDMLGQAGYARAIWVGLSMGGYVVLDIHRRHPDAVAGLALLDTKADADAEGSRALRLDIARRCDEERSVEPVMHFALAGPQDSSVKRSPGFGERFANWIRDQSPEGVAWRQRMAAGRPDLNAELAKIRVPSLVLCGDVDPSSPPAAMEAVAKAMAGSDVRMCVIADCGHFSAVERPDEVARALLDLVGRCQ